MKLNDTDFVEERLGAAQRIAVELARVAAVAARCSSVAIRQGLDDRVTERIAASVRMSAASR